MVTTAREVGTLIVVILKARNLPNKRHIGKQDPFCTVVFNDEKRRTKAIRRGGQHPEWDEEIRYILVEDPDEEGGSNGGGTPPPLPPKKKDKGPPKVQGGSSMLLACYADDPREPELIGEASVDLTEVLTKGETDEWFTLMYKDKYCGEVYLELTFWSNEPAPVKKSTTKQKMSKQYGGPGSFVPSGEIDVQAAITRLPSSASSYMTRDSIPSSLRSANSMAKLDLYVPPYESMRSSYSSVDGVMNEFAQLGVSDGSRRESFPPPQGHHLRRPSSFADYSDTQGLAPHPAHNYRHSTYSDSGYSVDRPVTPTGPGAYQSSSFSATPDPYQAAYESTPPPQPGYQVPVRQVGPRYNGPSPSSGFVPMPTPAPSGFVPLARHTSQPTTYAPQVPPTPVPGGYRGSTPPHPSALPPQQAPPSQALIPASSYSTLPSASSGFNTSGAAPVAAYHHHSLPQPSVNYGEPPPVQSQPASSWAHWTPPGTQQQSATMSWATWQSNSSQPPNTAVAPPPQQQSYGTPASSFPPGHSYTPPQTERQHSAPLPGQPPPGSQLLPGSQIPPPPALSESQSSSQVTRASRPLPQPRIRRSSLPVPPPANLQYPNMGQSSVFPSSMSYSSIPPPPPLPQHVQQTGPPINYQDGSRLPVSIPPPPALPAQPPSAPVPPSRRRPSLPAPPVTYAQQQSAFQALPPPPPPPALPSHIQHETPASSFVPSSSQTFYPGPPPRPPVQLQTQLQYLPPPANGSSPHSGYSSPLTG